MYSAEYAEPQATVESSRQAVAAQAERDKADVARVCEWARKDVGKTVGDRVREKVQGAIAERRSNGWDGPRPYSYEDEEWKDLWHWAMTLYWEKAWENLPATPENEAWKRTLEWMYHTLDEKR